MKRLFSLSWLLTLSLLLVLSAAPCSAGGEKDPCAAGGITVRNATMLNLWYKKNNGPCQIWVHEHLIKITPEDRLEIFSDLTCETLYCAGNPKYEDYRDVDSEGDCRVKILPYCNVSDM